MTLPILLGVGGRLAAGKDTVADHLVDKYGFKKLGMSDPLAAALERLNPVLDVDTDGYKVRYGRLLNEVGYVAAKNHPEVRRLLQTLGTEIGRNMLGENTWVDIAGRNIDDARAAAPVVITGIRFKNELEMIRARGGILLYVDRPSAGGSAHASETSLQPADFDDVLMNAGSIEELFEQVRGRLPIWSSKSLQRGEARKTPYAAVWPPYDN